MHFWPFSRQPAVPAWPASPDWVLYTASDCHLCDEAQALLRRLRLLPRVRIVEITDSIELLRCYRRRIPVLNAGDIEPDWPFVTTDPKALSRGRMAP